MTDLGSAGFRAWLQTTDLRRPVSDYETVLRGTIAMWEKTEENLRELENQMATLANRFRLALQRVNRGLPGKPVEFRCSHCGKTTPILLEMTFSAMAGERDETSDQAR